MSDKYSQEDSFGFLRNRAGIVANPSAKSFKMDNVSKRNIAFGFRDYFPREKKPKSVFPIKLISIAVSLLIFSVIFSYSFRNRLFFSDHKAQKVGNIVKNGPKSKTEIPESSRIVGITTHQNVGKKAPVTNRNEINKPAGVKPFSDLELNTFLGDIRFALQRSKDLDEKVNSIDTETVVYKVREGTNLIKSNQLSNYEKLEKSVKKFKTSLSSVMNSEKRIKRSVMELDETMRDFKDGREKLQLETKKLLGDEVEIRKFKEEIQFIRERNSDIRIQIENAAKNLRKGIEAKESLELEKEILDRSRAKTIKDKDNQEKTEDKLRNEVKTIEKEISSLRLIDKENTEKKASLVSKKKEIKRKISESQKTVSESNDSQKVIEIRRKEVETIINTIKNFEELQQSLKKEISDYNIEANKTAHSGAEQRKQKKIKEYIEVEKRIKDFLKKALLGLMNIFYNEELDFNGIKNFLEKELENIKKSFTKSKEGLETEQNRLENLSSELKSLEKEILLLSESKSITNLERSISFKKDRAEFAVSEKKRLDKEKVLIEDKISKINDIIHENSEKISAFTSRKKNLEEELKTSGNDLRLKEKAVERFVREKKLLLNSLSDHTNELSNAEDRIRRQKIKIGEEEVFVQNEMKRFNGLKKEVENLFCGEVN